MCVFKHNLSFQQRSNAVTRRNYFATLRLWLHFNQTANVFAETVIFPFIFSVCFSPRSALRSTAMADASKTEKVRLHTPDMEELRGGKEGRKDARLILHVAKTLWLKQSGESSMILLVAVLQAGLEGNFAEVKVSVVECPDLTKDPFCFPVKGKNPQFLMRIKVCTDFQCKCCHRLNKTTCPTFITDFECLETPLSSCLQTIEDHYYS